MDGWNVECWKANKEPNKRIFAQNYGMTYNVTSGLLHFPLCPHPNDLDVTFDQRIDFNKNSKEVFMLLNTYI